MSACHQPTQPAHRHCLCGTCLRGLTRQPCPRPPPGCPRLFDLIKIKDARLRSAFFYACGNTLVAKDLDQASRIAYGQDRRFRRVVTLQVRAHTCVGPGKAVIVPIVVTLCLPCPAPWSPPCFVGPALLCAS